MNEKQNGNLLLYLFSFLSTKIISSTNFTQFDTILSYLIESFVFFCCLVVCCMTIEMHYFIYKFHQKCIDLNTVFFSGSFSYPYGLFI